MLSSTPLLSKALYRCLTAGLRSACRSNPSGKLTSYSSLDQPHSPRFTPSPPNALFCHANPKIALDCLPSHYQLGISYPHSPNYTTFPPKHTPTTDRNPSMRTYRSASCVLFYVLPLPPFFCINSDTYKPRAQRIMTLFSSQSKLIPTPHSPAKHPRKHSCAL